jgi:hypothetical protein
MRGVLAWQNTFTFCYPLNYPTYMFGTMLTVQSHLCEDYWYVYISVW